MALMTDLLVVYFVLLQSTSKPTQWTCLWLPFSGLQLIRFRWGPALFGQFHFITA